MESYPVVWGVDIGHTSIKAVKLARVGEEVTVLGYSIEPIASGEEVDRDEAVITALSNIAQREDMMTIPVVVSLSGRQIFARTINIPVINKNKVAKMVELEARQQIPGDFNEVVWHYHLSPSLDGASYDVALFAARREIINELIVKAKQARVNLVGISVTSLAVYNFVRFDQEFSLEETIIVLDVGAENTDLVVYKGDTLWIRNLGVSGNDITRAFMKKFRVSFEEAETLKCQVGESRQAEKIFRVIEGSLGELISDVQRSLGFYKSQNEEAKFENVVVSGNTFKLPNLAQFMADRLGYAIITLVELERIKVDPELERGQFLEDLQSLGVSMGLALQGLGVAHADINLLPTTLRVQSILKTKRWAAVAILLLLPLAISARFLIYNGRMQEYWTAKGEIDKEVIDATSKEKDARKLLDGFTDETKPVVKFRDFGLHKGALRHLEASIFRMIEEIRREQLALPPEQRLLPEPFPLKDGGDVLMYPVYLTDLKIPDQEIRVGPAVFRGVYDGRTGVISIKVPKNIPGPVGVENKRIYVDQTAVRQVVIDKLNSLTISREMWDIAFPGESAPNPLPPLFKRGSVKSAGNNQTAMRWYYLNLNLRNSTGDLAPEGERRKMVEVGAPTMRIEFKLRSPAEWLDGKAASTIRGDVP
jgi:type IV pilus assembly protein PilM